MKFHLTILALLLTSSFAAQQRGDLDPAFYDALDGEIQAEGDLSNGFYDGLDGEMSSNP